MALSRTQFYTLLTLLWGLFAFRSIGSAVGSTSHQACTDAALIQLVLYELAVGGIVLTYLSRCGWRLSPAQIGFSWQQTGAGFLLYAISYLLICLAWWLAIALGGNPQPVIDLVAGERSLPAVLLASIVNGTYEELVLIAFVFKALERHDTQLIVGVSVLLRVIAHIYQGPVGAMSILAFGILMALAYVRFRQIWPLIVAHIVADFVALTY